MASGKNGDQYNNTEAAVFIMMAVVVIALGGIWFFARAIIVWPAFAMDYVSILAIEYTKGIGETGQTVKSYAASVFDGRRDPWNGVSWGDFYHIRELVGMQTRLFVSAIILGLSILIAFKMKGGGYARTFSLGGGKGKPLGLNDYQSQVWKVATSSATFDPDGRNKSIMPASTPFEWLRDNKVSFENGILDRDAAEEAFIKQLGVQWDGVKKAGLIHQAIAILCGLHMLKRKEALPEREALSIAWSNGQDGTKQMQEMVDRHIGDEKLIKVIERFTNKHAYAQPALIALLDAARARGGVLASADFLWLRWTDRNLHYALNNVGRRRFHTEGAASICHYFAEKATGNPNPDPYVENAIDGIEDYLEEQGIESLSEFWEREKGEFDDL